MVYGILSEFPNFQWVIRLWRMTASGSRKLISLAPESPAMFQRITVSLLLKSVILTLSAAIVVVLSFGAWSSWKREAAVKRIAGVVDVSANFFTALHNLRVDRATTFRELMADRQNAHIAERNCRRCAGPRCRR